MAYHRWIRVEPARPEPVAHEKGPRTSGALLLGDEEPARHRLDPESFEVGGRRLGRPHPLRALSSGQVHGVPVHGSRGAETSKRPAPGPKRLDLDGRDTKRLDPFPHRHEERDAVEILDGSGLEEEGIDDASNGGGGSDPEGEAEKRREREYLPSREFSDCEFQVVHTGCLARRENITEVAQRSRASAGKIYLCVPGASALIPSSSGFGPCFASLIHLGDLAFFLFGSPTDLHFFAWETRGAGRRDGTLCGKSGWSSPRTGRIVPGSARRCTTDDSSLPDRDESCYLCPGQRPVEWNSKPALLRRRIVFENDHPCVGKDAPQALEKPPGIYRVRPATGVARVVCFSPRHNLDSCARWRPKTRRKSSPPGSASIATSVRFRRSSTC